MSKNRKKNKLRRQRQAEARLTRQRALARSSSRAPSAPAERDNGAPSGQGQGKKSLLPLRWVWKIEDLRNKALSPEGRIDLGKVREVPALRNWLENQRQRYLAGKHSQAEKADLEELGMDWDEPVVRPRRRSACAEHPRRKRKPTALPEGSRPPWEEGLARLQAAVEGHPPLGLDDFADPAAREWLMRQRARWRQGTLPDPQKAKIDEIVPFDWTAARSRRTRTAVERWEEHLGKYLERARHLGRPPRRAELPESVRSWAHYQRYLRGRGKLPEEKIRRLDEAGFEWEPEDEATSAWWDRYRQVAAIAGERGSTHLDWQSPGERKLAMWLAVQRRAWREGRLEASQVEALERLGVAAEPAPVQRWREQYDRLRVTCVERYHGRLPPPGELPADLRSWVQTQRRMRAEGRLQPWQIEALDRLNMDWREAAPKWQDRYEELKKFQKERGHIYVTAAENPSLAEWLRLQRGKARRGELSGEKVRLLRELDSEFEGRQPPTPAWMVHYRMLEAFHQEHGHTRVPRDYPPDPGLFEWVAAQKQRRRKGRLTRAQVELLDRLDLPPAERRPQTRSWEDHYRELKAYHRKHEHSRVAPSEDRKLAMWTIAQRARYREGTLDPQRKALLDKVDFVWESRPKKGGRKSTRSRRSVG